MRLRDPVLRSALAGEYVAGTLIGTARKRFERLLANDPLLRGEVESWQTQLYQLVDLPPPQTPPVEIWEKLSSRIIPREVRPKGLWGNLFFWRSASVLACAFSVLLLIGVEVDRRALVPTDYQVIVADAEQHPAWLISTTFKRGKLAVQTLLDQHLSTEESFELWLIVSSDTPPISLVLIPENGAALAVSLEPAGGSPTGLPTGAVLYQGVVRP